KPPAQYLRQIPYRQALLRCFLDPVGQLAVALTPTAGNFASYPQAMFPVSMGKDLPQVANQLLLVTPAHLLHSLAHPVNLASLPQTALEMPRNRRLDALVSIRDHYMDP